MSTSGASPAVAKYLRLYLESLVPQGIGKFLRQMRQLRERLPKGKERMKLLDEKAKEWFKNL